MKRLIRWICQYRLIGLIVLATTTLTACGGISEQAKWEQAERDQELRDQDFLSRVFPSGDVLGEWNYIWGCEVHTLTGVYSLVPLRFYRDGRFQAGIGNSEVLGTWEMELTAGFTFASGVMTLDEAAPQLFGTNNKQLLVDLWSYNQKENLMQSGFTNLNPNSLPEGASVIDWICVRYTKTGDIVGSDPANWQSPFDETPTFFTTGEASIQHTPTNPSPSNQDEDTNTSDDPTSEPGNSPTAGGTPSNPVTQPSSTSPLAEINAQIKDIWYTNDFVDTVTGVNQRQGSVIQFNNNEVSRDGETISNEGIAASKLKNPEYWGEGRVSNNGLLSYKWLNSRSWLEPFLSVPTRAYPRNQKLRGCFQNTTGAKGPGSSPRIYRLCFFEDGSFKLEDPADNKGTYLIEDHAIRLDFSSGDRVEFLFGAYYQDEFIYRLIIADLIFYPAP